MSRLDARKDMIETGVVIRSDRCQFLCGWTPKRRALTMVLEKFESGISLTFTLFRGLAAGIQV